ncbi:MBL fold metallo-hydrolase [Geobacter sp. FeAm09]|uniref:MBL fold metallo-hydrolase n=1 Tax=Geobacter sp. FeAm09 TaxID=2597769 RepID=UPI0011EED4F6|nr:MBL fold metallo-hydrolase [Geobacter sp. FeAm09]QEM69156.1 MBL fold metallo-hydrolase [Geobacter sp. FeAm09]
MKRASFAMVFFIALSVPVFAAAASFRFQKVGDDVYAAIAEPGSRAASNCLIVVADYQVILAGAHFTKATTRELIDFVGTVTPLQVRYVVLTHHHSGFDALDTDFPRNADIITSRRTWQILRKEPGRIKNQVIFFDQGLTIKRGSREIVMTATERGHSEGDVFVTLPEDGVLFASDLLFNDVGGYMGDGYFRDWLMDLDTLAEVGARTVVPGLGGVTNGDGIRRFQSFFRDFTTEILRLAAKGLDADAAKREFSLPQFQAMPGFRTFFDANFRRAYTELRELQ